jgi:ABC-type antimicrobial peptide transport system permease subunit
MSLSEATNIALKSEGIQKTTPIKPGDATILFLNVKQDKLTEADADIKKIIGEGVYISSPMSILEKFKGIIAFFTSFSNMLIVIVAITSLVIVVLCVMQSVNLRKHEFGILKVVGWKPSEIKKLVITETVVVSLISAIAGIAFSCGITLLFGLISIDIPIPWESNSATPHFLMSDPMKQTTMNIHLPVVISFQWIMYSLAGSCIAGFIIGFLSGNTINTIKPSEVIKHG